MKKIIVSAFGCLALVFVSGCASMVTGTTQHIPITSNPPGAKVTIDGELKGTTPLSVDLERKPYHSVTLELEGYHPYQVQTTKGVNPWLLGDMFIPPWIPWLAIDLINGGSATIEPPEITGQLQKQDSLVGVNAAGMGSSLVHNEVQVISGSENPSLRLKTLKELKE